MKVWRMDLKIYYFDVITGSGKEEIIGEISLGIVEAGIRGRAYFFKQGRVWEPRI